MRQHKRLSGRSPLTRFGPWNQISVGLFVLLTGPFLGGCVFDSSGLASQVDDAAVESDVVIGPDTSAVCGNQSLDQGEDCDGTNLGSMGCADLGFSDGTLGCTSACTYDVSGCTGSGCGDNVLDVGEQCDGTNLNNETCATRGFSTGELQCDPVSCEIDATGCYTCGDGIRTGLEVCDATDFGQQTCADNGYDGGSLICGNDCDSFDLSSCSTCGDATRQGDEECDDQDFGGATCLSLNFDGGSLACSGACTLDDSGCSKCGNGSHELPDEECDNGAANSDSTVDACRSSCLLPWCGDGVCDTEDRGQVCPQDCTTVLFTEDFEGAWPGNWSLIDLNTSDGEDLWGLSTTRAQSATHSLWCYGSGSGSTFGYDNNQQSHAEHAVNLSGHTGSVITLDVWMWWHTDESADWVAIGRSDDGINFAPLETLSGDSGGWVHKSYDLSTSAGVASFHFSLFFQSDGGSSVNEGAFVDDIVITAVR